MNSDYNDICESCENYDEIDRICIISGEHVFSDDYCDDFKIRVEPTEWKVQKEIDADKVKLERWLKACRGHEK